MNIETVKDILREEFTTTLIDVAIEVHNSHIHYDDPKITQITDTNFKTGELCEFLDKYRENLEYTDNQTISDKIKFVDSYGGSDEGTDYWFVFTLPNEDGELHYIRVNAFHASWEGVTFESLDIVQPKPVVVTNYDTVLESEKFDYYDKRYC